MVDIGRLQKFNARYGRNTVYLGSIHQVRKEGQTRNPFGPLPPLEGFDDTADKLRTKRGAASEHEKSAKSFLRSVGRLSNYDVKTAKKVLYDYRKNTWY